MLKKLPACFFSACAVFSAAFSQQTFYDLNTIQKIEINFTQSNWDYQMDTAKAGSEGYVIAAWARVNGIQYDSVGVKYKGNSSYSSTRTKNPLHMKLDYIKGNQDYQNITDIKLANIFQDPSMLREPLAYQILSSYMDCPRANFSQVYINGTQIGLYTNDESISKDFCNQHFYSKNGTFIKCNPETAGGPSSGKSNLIYISTDSSQYFTSYDLQSDYGWNDVAALCDTVTNNANGLSKMVDIDKTIWMLAFNNLAVNLDSYSGNFAQNYYLYKDLTGHYDPVVWDLNQCFGSFSMTGTGTPLSVTGEEQMSTLLHSTDALWPLIKDILSNSTYKKMYYAHMRTMNNEMFVNGNYQTLASSIQAIIDTAVQSDPNKFFTYPQYQSGMTQNVTSGMGTIPGVSVLMNARSTYLQGTADFQYAQPAISAISAGPTTITIGNTAAVIATVTNANTTAVYLGYRFSSYEKFTRVLMYDDGMHNDGTAGDNVSGAAVIMSSAQLQYYIYAENNNSAMFSPERAEFNWYTFNAALINPNPGDIVINEVLANNVADTVSQNYKHSDWIELYNTTSQPLSLSSLYLSTSTVHLTKWQFPTTAFIPANGYALIWADNDTACAYYHANFKISATADTVFLSNGATLFDSVRINYQYADISTARCPDGTGTFQSTVETTPYYSNLCNGVGINEINEAHAVLSVYPNPCSEYFIVQQNENTTGNLKLIDVNGKLILNENLDQPAQKVSIAELSSGFYVYKYLSAENSKIFTGKISVQR